MTPRTRWALWGVLLVGAASLAVFGDKTPVGADPAATVVAPRAPAARPPVANGAPHRPAAEPLEPLRDRQAQAAAALPPRGDLFATPAWRRAAPPAAARPVAAAAMAPPPPPPQAPALPYRFVGKLEEGGQWRLFLGRDDSAFVVREGDTLEAAWRVARIAPPQAVIQHLPTGQDRNLDIGPAP